MIGQCYDAALGSFLHLAAVKAVDGHMENVN